MTSDRLARDYLRRALTLVDRVLSLYARLLGES